MVTLIRFLAAAIAFSAGSVALTLPRNNATLSQRNLDGVFCGIDLLAPGLPVADEALLASHTQALGDRQIQVIWHAIHKDNTVQGGYLPKEQIDKTIAVLNQHYRGTGFSFVLAGGGYVPNPGWFENADSDGNENGENDVAKQMKRALHKGTAQHLNIYSTGLKHSGLFGYATFPWWYVRDPQLDGVVFKWSTVSGGIEPGFGTGKILVHEVGHWLGLLHTFQGGCNEAMGDYVTDTPAEASPARGCPTVRDTCPGAGSDPIHNHMDYTDDGCRNEFTSGQVYRMKAVDSQYRLR
ncbi:unnamed protein product [Rhizoctonia solani]|uniref:Peptidase M43 pregnancy-associated plasma-A domain-containing protein n=1 Tax=Rhizoctonia solani TaxID=456999 RepID=A0A8H3AQD6_9AGAM|nr:unnamed protein product [Rhizoctonia solani]